MEIKQKFKHKDHNGQLVEKEIKLEFREIDRCRRDDAKLFYKAMNLISMDESSAFFTETAIEDMGSMFMDALLEKSGDLNETDFALMKNDVVAVYQVNSEILTRIVAPFLAKNL